MIAKENRPEAGMISGAQLRAKEARKKRNANFGQSKRAPILDYRKTRKLLAKSLVSGSAPM